MESGENGLERQLWSTVETVYHESHRAMLWFAFRYVKDWEIAAEIVQDALLKILSHGPGSLRSFEPAVVRAWLFMAIRNRSLDWLDRNGGGELPDFLVAGPDGELVSRIANIVDDDEQGNPESAYGGRETHDLYERVCVAVETLEEAFTPREREVLRLILIERLTLSDVARRIGRDRKTIRPIRDAGFKKIVELYRTGQI